MNCLALPCIFVLVEESEVFSTIYILEEYIKSVHQW